MKLTLNLLLLALVICKMPSIELAKNFQSVTVEALTVEPVNIPMVRGAKKVPKFVKIESVNLDYDIQKYIFEVAEDYHISPYLIMAVIERESTYRIEVIGDNGKSFGLMQIQKKEHLERMERLGVTDLLNPKENILTGVDYLYELFQINEDIYWVLMCYNGGFGHARKNNANPTPYAIEVVNRSYELEKEMNRNELNFRKEKIRRNQIEKIQ